MSSFARRLPASVTRGLNSRPSKKSVTTPIKRWKILRGDEVQVMSGRDKGMQGTVLEVLRSQNQVVVENCKMVRGN